MKPLISIIVPIYNVEKYLDRCIESIVAQTYTNLEIILVNDGSPDNSAQICEFWREKDNRITVIHKENGGLSDARNKGLEVSSGEYISFIDSDDFVHSAYIEILYTMCKNTDTKISVCNFERFENENIKESDELKVDIKAISSKEALTVQDNDLRVMMTTSWGKLFKRDLWNNISFPKGLIHEDEATTYKIIFRAKKIVYTHAKLYYYFTNYNGIMNSAYSLKKWDIFEILDDRIDFYKRYNEFDLVRQNILLYMINTLEHYHKCHEYLPTEKQLKIKLKNKYRKYYTEVMQYKEVSLLQKLKWTVYLIFPQLFLFIKRVK